MWSYHMVKTFITFFFSPMASVEDFWKMGCYASMYFKSLKNHYPFVHWWCVILIFQICYHSRPKTVSSIFILKIICLVEKEKYFSHASSALVTFSPCK